VLLNHLKYILFIVQLAPSSKTRSSQVFFSMFIKTLQFNSITLLLINERNKSLSIGTSYFIHRFHFQTSSKQQNANTKVTTYL